MSKYENDFNNINNIITQAKKPDARPSTDGNSLSNRNQNPTVIQGQNPQAQSQVK